MKGRRALLVGIDHYNHAPGLGGCVADAKAVGELLATHDDGEPNFEARFLLSSESDPVTRRHALAAIESLLASPAEAAVLFFAGHGTENHLGGYLATSDTERYAEGVHMTDVLELARQSPVDDVVIILDSCHSGAFGNAPGGTGDATLPTGLSVLTAARSTEAAVEQDGRGLFSRLVCSALEGGAADTRGKVTIASVYAYVEEALGAWEQRPQLKAHVSELLVLRLAQETVPVDDLRELVVWFPTVDAVLPLTPGHEPTEEPADRELEKIFGKLQKMRAGKLVEPVGTDHMYYAALHSQGCQLTQLGQLYWRLARERRL